MIETPNGPNTAAAGITEQPVEVEEMPPYTVLRGHFRTDGTYKSAEELRTEYLHLTDDLIYQLEGTLEVGEQGEVVKRPEAVIFLDKSARPLAWLLKEVWPLLAREPGTRFEDGKVPPMPEMYFLNIDREQWVHTVDPQGVGAMDIRNIDDSILRSLRSIFVEPKYKTAENGQDDLGDVGDAPTYLDGKTVLIVDEVRSSGRTAEYSKAFLEKAIPEAEFKITHWMKGMTQIGQAVGNRDIPVWYKEDDVYGRGVADRNDTRSERSTSQTQRLGRYFLSTRHNRTDHDADRLRQDFAHLRFDLENQDVLFYPGGLRELDDIEERVVAVNGLTFETFLQKKRAQQAASKPSVR